MHYDIKRFEREGYTGDNHVQNKEWQVRDLEDEMRELGYVPVLDLEPHYTVEYLPKDDDFYFTLSVYATHVGKEAAWHTAGLMNGRVILRSTQNHK